MHLYYHRILNHRIYNIYIYIVRGIEKEGEKRKEGGKNGENAEENGGGGVVWITSVKSGK